MHTEDAYDAPELTLFTPTGKLDVLCELLIEFDNMKDNGIDLLTVVKFQGWKQFFNRLQGQVLYHLVIEFWIYVKSSLFQVTSFVFGKKIVIFEKLNAKLNGNDMSRIICEQMVEKESKLTEISKVISVSEKHSSKIKDLHPKIKV